MKVRRIAAFLLAGTMTVQNVNIDYCGIITLLKKLVRIGKCTEKEAQKIASYLSVQDGVEIILFP